jgi:ABC-type glycerol-3-phosphate transport system substrate-binding protein
MFRKQLSRRDFLKVVAAGSAGLSASIAGLPVSASERANVARQEPTVVTVFINGNLLTEADAAQEGQMFTIYLEEYNLQNNGVTAKYEGVVREDYLTKVRLQTAAGELDNTVIWSGFAGISNFAIDGVIEPIDQLMAGAGVKLEEWIEPVHDFIRYDIEGNAYGTGPVWGLPLWAHAGFAFLHYNEDRLNEVGAPLPQSEMTWQEVDEKIASVAKTDPEHWGIAWNPYGNRHDLAVELLYVAPFGGYSLDPTGTICLLNSDEAVEAYNYYNDILNVRHVSPGPVDQEAFGSYNGGGESGVLAMYRMGGWGAAWYLQREENANPKMGLVTMPSSFDGRETGRRGNTMGIDWYGVSANASNPDATFSVLYWITNRDGGIFQVDSGVTAVAPRQDVFEYEGLANNLVASMNAEALPGVDRLPRPANQRGSEINTLIQQRFAPVDNGEAVPDKAFLDQLTGEIQAILDMAPPEA